MPGPMNLPICNNMTGTGRIRSCDAFCPFQSLFLAFFNNLVYCIYHMGGYYDYN